MIRVVRRAIELLRAEAAKHCQALTEEILAKGLTSPSGKTPAASLNAMIAVNTKRSGTKSGFVRVQPGVFGLYALRAVSVTADLAPEELTSDKEGTITAETTQDEKEHRLRIPLFPTYAEFRHLLKIWPGRPRKQVTGLQAALVELRGTYSTTGPRPIC